MKKVLQSIRSKKYEVKIYEDSDGIWLHTEKKGTNGISFMIDYDLAEMIGEITTSFCKEERLKSGGIL